MSRSHITMLFLSAMTRTKNLNTPLTEQQTNQGLWATATGSKKQYSFRLTAENTGEVHLFECAIDLLSYATLMKLEGKDWRQFNLVSLAESVFPKAEN